MQRVSSEKYPLADERLPSVRVQPDTIARWTREAQRAIELVLIDQQSWYYHFDSYAAQNGYKMLYDKPDVRGGGRVRSDSTAIEFLGHARLNLALDDVVMGLHCETTADQRAVFAQLYQHSCLDGALLELFESHTPSDPFHSVAIKWLAITPTVRQLMSCRDYLYFEYCCTMQDARGRPVLVEYKKSVVLGPDEMLDHQLDIKRNVISVINTFHEENDMVVNIMQGSRDAASGNSSGAHAPTWASLKHLSTTFGRMLNTEGLTHSRALLNAGVRTSTLPERQTDSAVDCHVCCRKFALTRRRSWCRACGRTVCRTCTAKLLLPKDGLQLASHLPFLRTRFCHGCIRFAHEQHPKQSLKYGSDQPAAPMRFSERSPTQSNSFFGYSSDDTTSPLGPDDMEITSSGYFTPTAAAYTQSALQSMGLAEQPFPTHSEVSVMRPDTMQMVSAPLILKHAKDQHLDENESSIMTSSTYVVI